MQLPRTFAGRLRAARVLMHLEQDELGRQAGLSGHTIGRLERGETTWMRLGALKRLARVLEVTTDWLLAMDVSETDEDVPEDMIPAPHV